MLFESVVCAVIETMIRNAATALYFISLVGKDVFKPNLTLTFIEDNLH